MKNTKVISLMIIFSMILVLSSGCKNAPYVKNETSPDSQTAVVTDQENTPEEKAEAEDKKAELSHTYTTRFGEINAVTSPAFSFGYPDGWDIIKEDVTQTSEWVTLSNERGVSIDFINLHQNNIGGGSAVLYSELEVSKVADSEFVPSYVQAEDYSDLGKFMVAELKEIGTMDTTSDSDFIPVENGAVSYAVLPESSAGEQIVNSAYYMDLAFMYPTSVMFVASAPDGQFTPQEKADAIAILSSFRAE